MLNTRFREKTNAWPGFVDLFSNLVIILIFLLIVFVFLWTTTSVFNKNTGARKVAELTQVQQAQAEQIEQMTADKEEAEKLLIAARDALIDQENQIANQQTQTENLANAYEEQVSELEAQKEDLTQNYKQQVAEMSERQGELMRQVAELTAKLRSVEAEEQNFAQQYEEKALQIENLNNKLAELQDALKQAEESAKQKEVEYVEMSNQLNKALAEKVAELNSISQYQSQFYKQVKNALGENTSIKQDGDRFIVSSDILFGSGSYKLSADGKSQLKILSGIIKDLEDKIPSDINWIIRVDGHTDNKAVVPGTVGYKDNMQLSLLRATAVVNELVRDGVSKYRLIPSGFGDMHPVEMGNNPVSLQKNRRIELQLTNK